MKLDTILEIKFHENSFINEIRVIQMSEFYNNYYSQVVARLKKHKTENMINDFKDEDKHFNKNNCQTLVSSLPMRTKTNLPELKNTMKSKTKDLSEKEKSYVVFKWECDNIDYDAESYFEGRNADCTPEGVFKNGKTVCSGYSRLFQNIASHLGLNVLCVSCYSKGVGYQPWRKINKYRS